MPQFNLFFPLSWFSSKASAAGLEQAPPRLSISERVSDLDTRSDRGDDFSGIDGVVIATELVKWGIAMSISYYLSQRLLAILTDMGNSTGKGEIISARRVLAKRLKRPEIEVMDMNGYEARISADVLCCDELDTSFDCIGGMEEELAEVRDNVVLPMQMWELYKGTLNIVPCPTGVLLYGRPGTGKTLTAKAIAKECGATFINIKAGSLMDKWFGEADKLVTGVFSLARKLAPTIIFIDEMDTLLRKRESDSGSSLSMQGVLLSEWDGLRSSSAAPVVVLGATNRPMDLDKAFLRRMPLSIKIKVPNEAGREDILQRMLLNEAMDADVSLASIAARTNDFTGSDLRELVRVATLQRSKDVINQTRAALEADKKAFGSSLLSISKASTMAHMRPLRVADFEHALARTRKAGDSANDYDLEVKLEETHERMNLNRKALKVLAEESGANADIDVSSLNDQIEKIVSAIERMKKEDSLTSEECSEPKDDQTLD